MSEKFSLMLYDFQILYLPNIQALENLQMLENLSEADTYQIIKRFDIAADLQNNKEINMSNASLSINLIEIKLTNR